jgi:hypothetical protein
MYWLVENQKTHSKGQALIWANGDLKKIKFYFNDLEWKDKNYGYDPDKTFEQLAIEQCRYFRENSNRLCLWLSGGYDSETILYYFSKTKIQIDEIVIYRRDFLEDNEYKYALKNAQEYKKNIYSKVEIIFSEITGETAHNYYKNYYLKMKENFVLSDGLSVRFSKTAASYQIENNDYLMKSIKLKSKRIDLLGFEKPRVYLYNKQWFVYLPDSLNYDFTGEKNFVGFYINDFNFYIKQVHMIINWLESLPDLSEKLVHDIQSHKIYYKEWNLACGRIPIFNPWSMHGGHKAVNVQNLNSPDSKNQLKNFEKSKVLENYYNGIDYLKNYCKWWSGKEDLYDIATILSEAKFVRKLINKNKQI